MRIRFGVAVAFILALTSIGGLAGAAGPAQASGTPSFNQCFVATPGLLLSIPLGRTSLVLVGSGPSCATDPIDCGRASNQDQCLLVAAGKVAAAFGHAGVTVKLQTEECGLGLGGTGNVGGCIWHDIPLLSGQPCDTGPLQFAPACESDVRGIGGAFSGDVIDAHNVAFRAVCSWNPQILDYNRAVLCQANASLMPPP